jgi:hypothetical protein
VSDPGIDKVFSEADKVEKALEDMPDGPEKRELGKALAALRAIEDQYRAGMSDIRKAK